MICGFPVTIGKGFCLVASQFCSVFVLNPLHPLSSLHLAFFMLSAANEIHFSVPFSRANHISSSTLYSYFLSPGRLHIFSLVSQSRSCCADKDEMIKTTEEDIKQVEVDTQDVGDDVAGDQETKEKICNTYKFIFISTFWRIWIFRT